ncbi:DUF2071 domain-containing protein [Halostella sp. JP-L12]|uniref:YqjF family protein n=1 Tax=Halostella TaxID=1843185 RepID=UPI0013CF0F43|nr:MULTISPECIES: DUF2071 domain-containing protein [Halostella]NHN48663.1 DUF2071 domain-containing protein [Halostella sp. JP-L12]
MGPSLLSMEWRDLLFAHYPLAPDRLRARLPEGASLDTYDGQAWLGVVALTMGDVRPRFAPLGLTFPQVNLRTYVTIDGEPGVYFLSMDADERLAVTAGRRALGVPYFLADASVSRRGAEVRFESERIHAGEADAAFRATYGPDGPPEPVRSGTLAEFAIDRYRFYLPGRDAVYTGVVDHDPWTLRTASVTIDENTLFAASDIGRPAAEPRCHVAPAREVTLGDVGRRRIEAEPRQEPVRI